MDSRRWLPIALAATLALGACGGDDDGGSGGHQGDPIKIGISLPLTGEFSEPGKGIQRGYEAWAKIVNEDGGLLGRPVELKFLDDQSNADRVVSDYEQLIGNDQVDIVFGPFSTRLVVPAARVADEYGMLFVEPAGAAPEVFEQGFDNLFYAAPEVADDHYNLLAEHILEMPKDGGVCGDGRPVRAGDGIRPQGQAGEVRDETVVNEVSPPNTTDFGSIAAKIAKSRADMVVGGTQYQDAVNLIVALQQLDYQPELAAFSTAPTNPEFSKAIGDKTEGILSPTGYTPEAPFESNVDFVKRYKEQFGSPPAEDEANAYTTGQVVAAAVEAAGCAEQGECQKKLVDWLRNNEVETVVRPLSWDDKGRPQRAHMIQQYVDGKIRIVLPEDLKEAGFVFPKPKW
jgi:branched-chain amino acid transport system substrate-binding protein